MGNELGNDFHYKSLKYKKIWYYKLFKTKSLKSGDTG